MKRVRRSKQMEAELEEAARISGESVSSIIRRAVQEEPSYRSAIGTGVIPQAGDWSQLQEIQGGSSYQATNDFRLHFGLGELRMAKKLIVRWRSGTVQTFDGVAANLHYRLNEGGKLKPRLIEERRVQSRTASSRTDDGLTEPAQ